ncbi:MAG: hypothetical protein ACTHML_05825 [Ginsengibacter sp.]
MLQLIAYKFKKPAAYLLFVLFYLQSIIFPLHAAIRYNYQTEGRRVSGLNTDFTPSSLKPERTNHHRLLTSNLFAPDNLKANEKIHVQNRFSKTDEGGPTSPEASTFKAVGSDHLVNLFTGDFSYSIPLMDVGGYPVNLFYNGGISMEQEASWVGLGWNINPGTVNRNMRGVPDDFDGEDSLIQTQNVKPNRTWGGEVGVDGEALGVKKPKLNFSLGFSYNNYLGPALDLGAGISLALPLQESIKSEKSVPSTDSSGSLASLGLNAKLSSRSGLTFSPSLNVQLPMADNEANIGIGLSTSYNSRTGIKDININSQMSTYNFQKKSNGTYDRNFLSSSLEGSTISFARPTYIPTLRMPMEYSNYSGQLEFGVGMFGLRGAAHAQGYYSESKVPDESKVIYKPMVGFIYSEKANTNKDAVMDFSRLNDAEVTPNTPVISAPQYAYDIFSIQGEGTGGTIRAYRGDLGFMRDNETTSKDKNISIGFDIAPAGHYGGNWNMISSPTKVGGWNDGNNTLLKTMMFKGKTDNSGFENVYFRNPGEATVTNAQLIDRIGGDNLVRFKLGGSKVNPRLESQLELFDKNTLSYKGLKSIDNSDTARDKRTQVTTMLTASEASVVGLEENIRNYSGSFDADNNIEYADISRTQDFRKGHHISEIDVLEQDGMRYVYGVPVYNIRQKDYTFSTGNTGDTTTGMVTFTGNEPSVNSPYMANSSKLDGYMMSQETPAYASSFLLTGLLSPDYVDVTGDGITEDDLGTAVKFDYTKSADVHKWRTPRSDIGAPGSSAHFNDGLRTERKDNKAIISYGEREVWYLDAIESKSMIAIFKTSDRDDAKGVMSGLDGTINPSEHANKKLDTILLYTKAEIKANGINNARPVKTVVFTYNYSLCKGTPDNKNGAGKLTLASIHFIYNGEPRSKKDQYVFNYGDTATSADNPSYARNASDRWGTYKDPDTNPQTNPAANPSWLTNADYPYTSPDKTSDDQFAAAWSLKKILLPSGAQMEVQYEADDYAYVQDRRACNMLSIYGFGDSTESSTSNALYNPVLTSLDNYYVYVKLPKPLEATDAADQKKEIFDKYLKTLNQLAFRLWVNMPDGPEPLTIYATYDDYGLCTNDKGKGASNDIIYLKLHPLDNQSPLSKSAIDFLTENLPGQAFQGYDIEVDGIQAFLEMAGALLTNFKNAFKNVDDQMRSEGKARTVVLGRSFIRLDNPYKMKYGGGVRVKQIVVKDNWEKMKGKYTSVYGQDYDYTTTENINGKETVISSGVASYEPGIGSEENPFREIISYSDKMPLASAQYGAIETPVLDGLYPAPSVGYSKVTVRSIHRNGTHGDSVLRSAIGKQVTEFYTARDYPTVSKYTGMEDKEYHFNSFYNLLYKEITDRKVVSQGFLVETNDMHGKMKKQSAYSESDENTPLSYSYYTYKNTGKNGLNDKVDFVHNDQGGVVTEGNIGVDMELMTDVREFKTQVNDYNGQIQTDFFTFVPWPVFVVPMLAIKTNTENKYRAVTCTKLINYHAIVDSVIVMDKGSMISTETVAYDAETGAPVITKTANEFNDPVYSVTYPAYWAYSGMSPAYKNVDRQFSKVNFYDGKIISGADTTVFESGDELYVTYAGAGSPGCISPSPNVSKLWAYDKNKDTTALTVPHNDLVFMDASGKLFTKSGVSFRIIRSGKRNLLNNSAGSVTMMANPIQNISGANKLEINNNSKVVAASASEYKEKWQTDKDVILRKVYYTPVCSTVELDSLSCNGILEKNINPYVKGLTGNFKPYRSYVYYGNRSDSDVTVGTAVRKNGYISAFSNFWQFNAQHNLVPDRQSAKWVWNSQVTKVNAKGQTLETEDALGRYNSSQFGFNKSLPVAVVENSRYGGSFAESFEDYSFNDGINKTVSFSCPDDRYINFIGSASIVNTDNATGIKAHTGKYELQVGANSQAYKSIDVFPSDIDNYTLRLPKDTTKALDSLGGNYSFNQIKGNSTYSIFFPNSAIYADVYPYADAFNYYQLSCDTYINILAAGTYDFNMSLSSNYNQPDRSGQSNGFEIMIVDINQNIIKDTSIMESTDPAYGQGTSISYSVYLCPGIYKIVGSAVQSFAQPSQPSDSHNSYAWNCSNCGSADYKDLTTVNGCIYTKSIAATDSMLNPVFKFIPGKKMLVSAWVKENCGTPCFKTSYDSSNVILRFGGSNNSDIILTPTGNIIEGWQKVEGVFTVPQDATYANLILSNNSMEAIYFDDIRIQPFNANMKSYVYDPQTLKLSAELDENNYATFYEYDEEGQLVRVKKETSQGIKTINETRSAQQKAISDIQ